ncbi:bacteriohemerythrin [Herbaspirillum sp. VT-16-41]|uniref:bacteriohemerythrin n=1 Tax=Herbaspirillum sp. VT-16-41 TaxID=1953765 RepID=UPI0009D0EA21|nr:hemerythrin family protein [Herbaspirillum sp. VT-16-41]ONN67705.1 hypothetical protein BTM36_06115 [Herbaspirillum sp. VT-16-41]
MDKSSFLPLIPLALAEMDRAHQQVLAGFVQLSQIPNADFAGAFDTLVRQIETGFRKQEELMDKIAYVGLKSHRKEHCALLTLLHRLKPYIDDGDTPPSDIVQSMMPVMFMKHMGVMDAQLASVLRDFEWNH